MASSEVSWHQRKGLRQLIKFCIVGASSTIIDKGTLWILLTRIMPQAPWWMSMTISFCFGVTNGFFWNRRWTFEAHSHKNSKMHAQYSKFFLTNIVGYMLNIGITKLFLVLFTRQVVHVVNPDPLHVLIASMCAIPFVVLWNFTAAKYWTFRTPKSATEYSGKGNQEIL